MADTDTLDSVTPYSTEWYNKMYALQKAQLEKDNLSEYSKRGMYRSGMGLAGLTDAESKLQSSLMSEMAANQQTQSNLQAQIASNEKIATQETEAKKEEAEATREAGTKSALFGGLAGVGGTLGGVALANYLGKNAATTPVASATAGTTAATPVTSATDATSFGSKLAKSAGSLGNIGAGLGGLALSNFIGGNQNKALSFGGLAGSGLGYGLGNTLSAGLNLGGGYGALASGLGTLGGNILGRQL